MFTLSTKANKDEYNQHMETEVLLGKRVVLVVVYTKDGRTGSYERGFKFTSNRYGGLYDAQKREVSFDHGATWVKTWTNVRAGQYYNLSQEWKKTPKGRVKLEGTSNPEFAFDKIQKLNREYFGPDYKWKP